LQSAVPWPCGKRIIFRFLDVKLYAVEKQPFYRATEKKYLISFILKLTTVYNFSERKLDKLRTNGSKLKK